MEPTNALHIARPINQSQSPPIAMQLVVYRNLNLTMILPLNQAVVHDFKHGIDLRGAGTMDFLREMFPDLELDLVIEFAEEVTVVPADGVDVFVFGNRESGRYS
jgi:hypothetical protein